MRFCSAAALLFLACQQGLGAQSVSSLPPFFEPNLGQFVDGTFHLVASEHQLVIRDDGFDVVPARAGSSPLRTSAGQAIPETSRVRFRFVSASRGLTRGESPLGFRSSYILSPNSQEWIHDVPAYGCVRLAGLYPGIDAVFTVRNGRVSYDFYLNEGADPNQVAFDVLGASRVWADAAGLHVQTPEGELVHSPPRAWQVGPQGPVFLDVTYRVEGYRVRFGADRWSRELATVVDPEILTANWGVRARAVAVGPNNRLFLLLYPSGVGSPQNVLEMDAKTGEILRRIVLSGDVWPFMTKMAITASGAMALGTTCGTCSNPPLYRPLQPGPGRGREVYFAVFTKDVKDLLMATFLGKDLDEELKDLIAGPEDRLLVAVGQPSPGLPTTPGAFRADCNRFRPSNTCVDDYVALVDPLTGTLSRATYLWREPSLFAFLDDGSLVIAGTSSAPDLPLVRAVDTTYEGREAFVYRLSRDFGSLHFATYLGGEGRDVADTLFIGASQTIWVAGETESRDFPLKNPNRSQLQGPTDGFLAGFSPQGDLQVSTYVGGNGADNVFRVFHEGEGTVTLLLSTQEPLPWRRTLRVYPQDYPVQLVEFSPERGPTLVSALPFYSDLPHFPFSGAFSAEPPFVAPTADGGWSLLAGSAYWHVVPGQREADLAVSAYPTSEGTVVAVTNHGPDEAPGVTVFSGPFQRLDYCPDCAIGALAPGQRRQWLSRVTSQIFSVSSSVPDPDPTNNRVVLGSRQGPVADLELTVEKQVTPNENIVVAHIKNLGPSTATVPGISWWWFPEVGPPGVEVTGQSSCWDHNRACIWEDLAPGQTYTVTFRFRVSVRQALSVALHVFHGGQDPNPSNDSAPVDFAPRTSGLRYPYIVPIVAHNPGAGGTLWRSDVWIVNRGSLPANLELTFRGNDGAAARASLTLGPGELHSGANVLERAFGYPPSANVAGSVWILADQPLALASRTYNATPGGTYGQGIPVLKDRDFWLTDRTIVPELSRDFRTNIGCFSRRKQETRVKIASAFNPESIYGCPPRPELLLVPPESFRLRTDSFAVCRTAPLLLARVESMEPRVDSLDGFANEWCFGSWVDPRSGDPTLVPPLTQGGELLPVVIHAPGLHGSFWQTDVVLAWAYGAPNQVKLVFVGPEETRERTVETRGEPVVVIKDVLVSVFDYPREASVSGVLLLPVRFEGDNAWAGSRTYTESAQGSFGQEFPLLPTRMASGVGVGEQGVVPVLLQNQDFRSNLGLVNVGGEGLQARVRIMSPAGREMGTRTFALGPWQRIQANEILKEFGLNAGYAVVETVTPGTYLWAYGSIVDNRTNDPTTVPLWRE